MKARRKPRFGLAVEKNAIEGIFRDSHSDVPDPCITRMQRKRGAWRLDY